MGIKPGYQLDVGCGGNKHGPDWLGIDKRALEGVDIVHDLEVFPWPLEDESVIRAIASHVIEHINPAGGIFIQFMNEIWRIMAPGGQFAIAAPHGSSQGYLQDPTHCNPCNQNTFAYFDPEALGGGLYGIYQPKPWKIERLYWSPAGNIEVILRKRNGTD